MSLDLRTLYPNLHAEATRHPSTSPRPASSKGTGRNNKPPDLDSSRQLPERSRLPRATQRASRQPRLPVPSLSTSTTTTTGKRSAITINQSMARLAHSIPTLPVNNACGSRPSTPVSPSLSRVPTPERSVPTSHPNAVKQPQPESLEDEASDPIRDAPRYLGKTRTHVLRGDLPVDATGSTSSGERMPLRSTAARTPPTRLTHSLSMASLPNAQPLLQELVVCSGRPRSRYARREIATPIQPLPHRLSQSASAPALARIGHDANDVNESASLRPSSSSSLASVSVSQPSLRSRTALPNPLKPAMLSWTEQDASSFFLTEVDAKDVADQWAIARALARGAHLLYGLREYDRAVACFADALTIAQQQQQQQEEVHQQRQHHGDGDVATTVGPLVALLHHHMGVAFSEDGQAKWALMMQKKALELAQQCGDIKLQARALKALGVLFLDRNEPQRALDCQQQALAMALETRDAELEARVYANLGNLAAAQAQFHHAIACHERDLATCCTLQLDSAVGQARAHRNLALVYAKMGDKPDQQLDHELHAARLEAANPFETDMRRHASDVVGNIYLQLTVPHATLADMVKTSVKDVLTSREQEQAEADDDDRDDLP